MTTRPGWAFFEGQLQLFRDGQVTMMSPEMSRDPLDLEEATVDAGKATAQGEAAGKKR